MVSLNWNIVQRRTAIALLLVMLFSACRPDADESTIVMESLLLAGEAPEVTIYKLNEQLVRNLEDPVASITDGTGNSWSLLADPNDPQRFTVEAGDLIIEAERSYELLVQEGGREARARVVIPPAVELIQVSSTTIPINSGSTGQPTFTVLWEANPDLSHVLNLEVLDVDAPEIPFSVPSGNFAVQYRFPVPGQGTTLFDTDFAVYGQHRLRIYAIPKSDESLYFYLPEEGGAQLTGSISNVQGGSGYVSSASYVDIELELIP